MGRHHHITRAAHAVLTVLGGLAEFERDLIRARTGEGRERAKARGVKMGRPHKLTDHQRREAIKRREGATIPLPKSGAAYNVSAATISQLTVWCWNPVMEFRQGTLAQILDSEKEMILTAPQRYGEYYEHAFECSMFLTQFLKSIDPDRYVAASV
jgi:DNA invertase Pin-like site-specific DNA recombinase